MKVLSLFAVVACTSTDVLGFQQLDQTTLESERFLVELSPGDTRWVREDEKWELKRVRAPSDCPLRGALV